MRHEATRRQVVETARRMLAEGLVTVTAGNISIHIPDEDLLAITPGGRPYDTMEPEDVAIVTLDGELVEGDFEPSSETPMHTMIMREMPDVHAIVHTHSPYATAFSVVRKPIPLVCNEGLTVGAMSVRVTEYGVPGTEEIGQRVIETLRLQPGSKAVLIANHGMLAVGGTIREAYVIASNVEAEAKIYAIALGVGVPVCMTQEIVGEILGHYR